MSTAGPSATGTVGHVRMEGREVFKHAVGMITDVINAAFEATGTGPDDIDWFVPHQANQRIIDASAKKLGIAEQQGRLDGRPARQHLGRLDPAGARRGGARRPHQARATSSCWRRWAAASPGARRWSAGDSRSMLTAHWPARIG